MLRIKKYAQHSVSLFIYRYIKSYKYSKLINRMIAVNHVEAIAP